MALLLPEKVLHEKATKVEYRAWYEKIMNYLGCCGLDDVVIIKTDASNEDEDENKQERFNKSSGKGAMSTQQKSWLAYSIIVSRLEDSLIIQFSTIEKGNASLLMSAINNRFNSVNFFSKLKARRDFNRISLKSSETISSYGARIKYAAKELELMDNAVKVGELELISRLVDGLPKDYDNLILGLVRGIETITFDEFVSVLESKCSLSKLKSVNKGEDSVVSDTSSANAIASFAALRKEFKGRCYNCGKSGHTSANCNESNQAEEGFRTPGNGGPGGGKLTSLG